jgi:hypothetical protein
VKQAPGGPSLPSQVFFGWIILSKISKQPTKSEPRLMQFAATTPHLLLLDHSMPSICEQ